MFDFINLPTNFVGRLTTEATGGFVPAKKKKSYTFLIPVEAKNKIKLCNKVTLWGLIKLLRWPFGSKATFRVALLQKKT